MTNAERFAKLFAGYTERYGRYELAGRTNDKGKQEGEAKTVDKTITPEDYAAHVKGTVGIGVIPLREDNKINFAAIDVDIYDQEAKAKRNLTHELLAERLADLPVIVTRSKSNGIHIWLFSEEGVKAKSAVRFLQALSSMLGVGGSEVFPKQISRGNEGDVGNWINLPYCGGDRVAVLMGKDEPFDANLEAFLTTAESAAKEVTDGFLDYHTKEMKKEPVRQVDVDELKDGPPCLQRLIYGEPDARRELERLLRDGEITRDEYDKRMSATMPMLDENRNIAFYNVAHYVSRKITGGRESVRLTKDQTEELTTKLHDIHNHFVMLSGNPGIVRELRPIAGSVARGGKGYECTKEPLASVCNRDLCRKREFGIGSSPFDVSVEVGNLTVVKSDPPQYYLTVGEDRIYVEDANTLLNQGFFRVKYTEQTSKMWAMLPAKVYESLMAGVFENPTFIDPLPDSDPTSMLLSMLLDFIEDKGKDYDDHPAAIHNGHVLVKDDDEAVFTIKGFEAYIKAQGFNRIERNWLVRILTERLGVVSISTPRKFAGRSARVYTAPIQALRELDDQYAEDEA